MKNQSKVIVRLKGGLGNQMFQYAFGRKLAQMNNQSIIIDASIYKKVKDRSCELDHFSIVGKVHDNIHVVKLQNQQLLSNFNVWIKSALKSHKAIYLQENTNNPENILYNWTNILKRNKILYWQETQNIPDNILYNWKKDIYLSGFWQGTSYFNGIEDILRKDFQLAQALTPESQKLKELILSSNSPVSVHIRRGDYANDPKILSIHGLCSIDYYLEAINLVQERLENATFFLFSNDPEWVYKNIQPKIPNSFNVSELNSNRPNYEDMILMSFCKHHIIANSTFSWWGAWLSSPFANKITIAPKRWFAADNHIDSSLIPKQWIRI